MPKARSVGERSDHPMSIHRACIFVWLLAVNGAMGQGVLGHDCQACHLTPRSAMSISGQQSSVNFGSGARKVFRVQPGQTAPIGINVTNGYDRYAVGITYPFPGGAGDTNRHLAYQPDPTWSDRSTFYVTPTTNVNQAWTFNLAVLTNSPPDFYLITIQTAGITNATSSVDEWNHLEPIYVQVLPPAQAPAPLQSPQLNGQTFSVQVPTTNGLAYFLEYKQSLSDATWTVVSQIPGNGSSATLSDTNATGSQRFYRVRSE